MKERIQQILTELERVQENLLSLSDDIWLSIDHNNSQALQKGVEFKLAFNEKLDGFNQITSNISELVQNFTNIHVETVAVAQKDSPEHEGIIRELDSNQPHTLEESFTYKGVNTWRHLYKLFCKQLAANELNRFKNLVESSDAKTVRGGAVFTNKPTSLIRPLEVASGIYAEGNLSANAVRDKIKFLLSVFRIDSQELSIYLREDRNAAQKHEFATVEVE